ncbi:MAG TPA: hypothetical protein VG148_05630 [Pyrinomonadaceae bacterium]|nr:hypothetical protein [Pyrinomonadaceae bacterium]
MPQASSGIGDELARRYSAAVRAVASAFALSSLLLVVAAVRWAGARPRTFKDLADETLGRAAPDAAPDPVLLMSLWIGVAFLGLGAIYFRRARFSPLRLQAVAGLAGAGGLLETLQKTTALVALVGAAIAVIGFASSLLTGLLGDMLRAWLISAVVLAYAYPRLPAWRRVVEAADDAGAEAGPAAKGTFA